MKNGSRPTPHTRGLQVWTIFHRDRKWFESGIEASSKHGDASMCACVVVEILESKQLDSLCALRERFMEIYLDA